MWKIRRNINGKNRKKDFNIRFDKLWTSLWKIKSRYRLFVIFEVISRIMSAISGEEAM